MGGRVKGSREETVYVEMVRTTELLSRKGAEVLKQADLSPAQYNILRILRGSPEGLSCGEIATRMITRDPDITRLLDRMEKRRLISRARDTQDRRTVVTRATAEGLELLGRLDAPVQQVHREQLGHLGEKRLKVLQELLAACREQVA